MHVADNGASNPLIYGLFAESKFMMWCINWPVLITWIVIFIICINLFIVLRLLQSFISLAKMLKRSFLSDLYAEQFITACNSFSTTFWLHLVHSLSSKFSLNCLPFSIIRWWAESLNFVTADLTLLSLIMWRYFSCIWSVLKVRYVLNLFWPLLFGLLSLNIRRFIMSTWLFCNLVRRLLIKLSWFSTPFASHMSE